MTASVEYAANPRNADWRGPREWRFRWRNLRREPGRRCYRTDWQGNTLAAWWEWER
jgi:hypothetical protein